MAEARIPVDLFNPGQVFACIGFAEAAEVLLGDAEGVFDWSDPTGPVFRLRAAGDSSPVETVLGFLDRAQARAVAPEGSSNIDGWITSFGPSPLPVERARGYPFPDPSSPATLACQITDGVHTLVVDYWGDATERDNVKFWGGSRGCPGAKLAADALALVKDRAMTSAADPFALGAPQSSSFRLDWRRDYIALHIGFSLNAHTQIDTQGFPLVELLAAIGLGQARPRRRDKLTYNYAVVGRALGNDDTWMPLSLMRAALGGAPLPFPMRHFKMLLDWPGKEGQDRSITTVTEETLA